MNSRRKRRPAGLDPDEPAKASDMVDIQALGGRATVEATRTRAASLLLEFAGSALLVTVVIAAALSGRLLSTEGSTQEFLLGSLAAAGALVAIGLAFPGIRANPLLTLLDLIADRVPAADAVGRIVVQVVGGLLGGVLGLWGFRSEEHTSELQSH